MHKKSYKFDLCHFISIPFLDISATSYQVEDSFPSTAIILLVQMHPFIHAFYHVLNNTENICTDEILKNGSKRGKNGPKLRKIT